MLSRLSTALLLCSFVALPAMAGRTVPNVPEKLNVSDVVADMVPHRAVFDMKLMDAAASSSITGLSGRMVFETVGSPCEGFTINFRFVTEVEYSEDKSRMIDMRTTTFEDGDGKTFQFLTQTFIDEKVVDESKGSAVRDGNKTTVTLIKPQEKIFTMPGTALFPTQHLAQMLRAARTGELFLPIDLYDGSEGGEKIFPTATAIGKRIDGPDDVGRETAAAVDAMSRLPRWPITVGYYDPEPKDGGESTPTYEMSFLLYENGISRKVKIDYGEYIVGGELVDLKIHEMSKCE